VKPSGVKFKQREDKEMRARKGSFSIRIRNRFTDSTVSYSRGKYPLKSLRMSDRQRQEVTLMHTHGIHSKRNPDVMSVSL